MKIHKFTNNSSRIVITWKTRNMRSLFPFKDKNDFKSYVIYKGDCSCSHVILVKPNATQKLDGMNLIIHPKVQNHGNTLEVTSIPVLHGLSFEMLQKFKDQQ